MADMAQLLAQLRAAASTQGTEWLQEQVAAVLGEREAAPVAWGGGDPTCSAVSAAGSLQSGPLPRSFASHLEARQGPSDPPAQHTLSVAGGEAGRNPRRGRSSAVGEMSAALGSYPRSS